MVKKFFYILHVYNAVFFTWAIAAMFTKLFVPVIFSAALLVSIPIGIMWSAYYFFSASKHSEERHKAKILFLMSLSPLVILTLSLYALWQVMLSIRV